MVQPSAEKRRATVRRKEDLGMEVKDMGGRKTAHLVGLHSRSQRYQLACQPNRCRVRSNTPSDPRHAASGGHRWGCNAC